MGNLRNHENQNVKSAYQETFEITFWYFVIAYGYLIISDWLLATWVTDPALLITFQAIKGISSLGLIGVVYYFIVLRKVKRFIDSNIKLYNVLQQLNQKNEALIELENKHYKLAFYDALTGLSNKNRLEQKVNRLIEQKTPFTLLSIDIDDFGVINELKGHVWGDHALLLIAKELDRIANGNLVARMSEDGFIILIKDIQAYDKILEFSNKLIDSIKELIKQQSEAYFYTASAGIASYPEHGSTYTDILRCSDVALGLAKKNGKDQIVFYNSFMHQLKEKEVTRTNAIKPSLLNNEFYIVYQPILEFNSLKINKVEALIRWQHPTLGFIPPNDFIYLSEISGSIVELTVFVCNAVFKQIEAWNQAGIDMRVDINISPKVLMHPEFLEDLNQLADQYHIKRNQVIIEVTESVILEKIDQALLVIKQLKEAGYLIALDDFGTGYSSLTYFKHLPVDIIKMDRGFIQNIDKYESEQHFLKFVLDLSHSLGKQVVLEGVETDSQVEVLKQFEVDFVQGFLYHKPLKVEELNELLNVK